jgi:hypothetical protein
VSKQLIHFPELDFELITVFGILNLCTIDEDWLLNSKLERILKVINLNNRSNITAYADSLSKTNTPAEIQIQHFSIQVKKCYICQLIMRHFLFQLN